METTDEFDEWFGDLMAGSQDRVLAGVSILREDGPADGRYGKEEKNTR
jgi:hypothetical protein